ncbi:hypothetical protein V6N12_038274 [Hibiscus sabdariffa]|uniref:Uncharacterized protein n=1 Tax=Hibiscus sabdariffa TaxID=183260 RepID=A0ABR1ZUR1_9ROSI
MKPPNGFMTPRDYQVCTTIYSATFKTTMGAESALTWSGILGVNHSFSILFWHSCSPLLSSTSGFPVVLFF